MCSVLKAVAASRSCRIALLAIIFATDISPSDAVAADNVQPVPQLIHGTRKGLDVENNKIDQLIHTFGFICEHIQNFPKACRIESELVTFLKKLPPNRADIARELTALGAACESKGRSLDCIYERYVENAGWITGSSAPVSIMDEILRIDLKVTGEDGLLRFAANYTRTSRLRDDSEHP